jgi:hypothetical protein
VAENTKFYGKSVGGHFQLPPPRIPQKGTTVLLYAFMGDDIFGLLLKAL